MEFLQRLLGLSTTGKISTGIREALESQYKVTPEEVTELRTAEKHGTYALRPVRLVRVYHSTSIDGDTGNTSYDQLEGSKAIWFQGKIEKKGQIFLKDVRPVDPMKAFRAKDKKSSGKN
jgi:hypothetical protein